MKTLIRLLPVIVAVIAVTLSNTSHAGQHPEADPTAADTLGAFQGFQCPQGYIVDDPSSCNIVEPEEQQIAGKTMRRCPGGYVAQEGNCRSEDSSELLSV